MLFFILKSEKLKLVGFGVIFTSDWDQGATFNHEVDLKEAEGQGTNGNLFSVSIHCSTLVKVFFNAIICLCGTNMLYEISLFSDFKLSFIV